MKFSVNIAMHAIYFAIMALLVSIVPPDALGSSRSAVNTVIVIGFLGAWRYSWALVNFVRATIYRSVVYPRWRDRAQAAFDKLPVAPHAYFMVTTYLVATKDSVPVYRALFQAAARSRGGATVVSSVVDGADERLIRELYDTMAVDMSNVRLVIDRIPSKGKRDAMAKAVRLIARECPSERDIMLFVDGDTIVPLDIVDRAAPFFTDPSVGALTTDESAVIDKPGPYKDWMDMRFDQRLVTMSSIALGRRVLTLTGRMSVFRASLAADRQFVDAIEYDSINHWRLGQINFLTGDDKSTWFYLLKNGYEMAFLPDVRSLSIEHQPHDTFFASVMALMKRWFGNNLRTSNRALAQSPRKIGYFTWWSIFDTRLSMWTTLVGPLSVAFTAMVSTIWIIPLYMAWVMGSRYLFCVIFALFRGAWFPASHPLLLYMSQVLGAIMKTFVLFRMDRQRWTRQGIASRVRSSMNERIKGIESAVHHGLALALLVLGIVLINSPAGIGVQ